MANLRFFSCVLLALCTLSSSANDFFSIDCGSSESYEDENGIAWTGDGEYVKTGESRSVEPSESFGRVTDTLRVFTNKRKNCYEVGPVKTGGRVLVRTTFYYGNYDGKSSPPEFYLILDGNYWAAVNNSGPTPSRYELIYATSKESVTVCVIQDEDKEGMFPYISALEVRSLGPLMYGGFDVAYPLSTRIRVDYGANATIVRYPYDPYDRRWLPETNANGSIRISSDEAVSNAMVSDDEPPPAVLRTAVTFNSSRNLTTMPILVAFPIDDISDDISVYINMYFCEVIRLKPNQTRSFYLFKDSQRFSPLISLSYGNCTRLNFVNLTVSSNTSFSLVATENSTLPPLINALEILDVSDYPMYNLTDANDVKGVSLLQETFGSLQDWSGDPCVPASLGYWVWAWVRCSEDSVPRVTSLVINGYGLSGLLPDFSSMDALHTINLSNNSLRGNIPDFLGELPNLQILNLENNQFNGTIPASLLIRKGLILLVGGNPELVCPSNTSISCQQNVPAEAPGPANSSINKKTKNNNILRLLFTIIIPSIILSHLN